MIEDILRFFRRACCCCGVASSSSCCCQEDASQLFPLLRRKQGLSPTGVKSAVPPRVYVYPNRSDDVLVYSDGGGGMKKTGFVLPRWIVNNAFKLIRRY